MSTSPHLDHWRITPLGDKTFAFGPVHLRLGRLTEKAEALFVHLAASPKHGALWSDAEALGLLGAQVSKEASRVSRSINRPFHVALRERACDPDFEVAPIVRSCKTHGSKTDPMCFAFGSGAGTMQAFHAALRGGFTGDEVRRLNKMASASFSVIDLREPEGFHLSERIKCSSYGWSWPNAGPGHPVWDAIKAICEANGDDAFEWPRWRTWEASISVHFNMHRERGARH